MASTSRTALQCLRQPFTAHPAFCARQFSASGVLGRSRLQRSPYLLPPEEQLVVTRLAQEKKTDREILAELPQRNHRHVSITRRALGLPQDPTKIHRPYQDWENQVVEDAFKQGKSDVEIREAIVEESRKYLGDSLHGKVPKIAPRTVNAVKKMRLKMGLRRELTEAEKEAYESVSQGRPSGQSQSAARTGGSFFGSIFGSSSNPRDKLSE